MSSNSSFLKKQDKCATQVYLQKTAKGSNLGETRGLTVLTQILRPEPQPPSPTQHQSEDKTQPNGACALQQTILVRSGADIIIQSTGGRTEPDPRISLMFSF